MQMFSVLYGQDAYRDCVFIEGLCDFEVYLRDRAPYVLFRYSLQWDIFRTRLELRIVLLFIFLAKIIDFPCMSF